jgi:hypothetical protein
MSYFIVSVSILFTLKLLLIFFINHMLISQINKSKISFIQLLRLIKKRQLISYIASNLIYVSFNLLNIVSTQSNSHISCLSV